MNIMKTLSTAKDASVMIAGGTVMLAKAAALSVPVVIKRTNQAVVNKIAK